MEERPREPLGVDPACLPHHVAIIMDGNGRWAQARGLPRAAGHRAGPEALRRVIESCIEFGIGYLTIFAFSTENWQRPSHEVRALLRLLEDVIERQLSELDANGIRLRHIGWMDGVPPHLAEGIRRAVAQTAHNERLNLSVAFNYGSRAEIVRAVRRIAADGVPADEIDEERFAAYLETAGLPDPDLVIRTAGEMRLSNFLLWQAAYSEIYSTPVLWPDFGRPELVAAIRNYAGRERRFGCLPGQRPASTPQSESGAKRPRRQRDSAGTTSANTERLSSAAAGEAAPDVGSGTPGPSDPAAPKPGP